MPYFIPAAWHHLFKNCMLNSKPLNKILDGKIEIMFIYYILTFDHTCLVFEKSLPPTTFRDLKVPVLK